MRAAQQTVLAWLLDLLQSTHYSLLTTVCSLHAGLKPADLESPNPASALQFLVNPSAQIQELQQALTALSGQTANSQVGLFVKKPCTDGGFVLFHMCVNVVVVSEGLRT